jgi:hypothetical protein
MDAHTTTNGKALKFRALAEKRVSLAMKTIRRIGMLSHRGSYEYEPEQIDKMFAALRSEITAAELQFSSDQPLLFRLEPWPRAV